MTGSKIIGDRKQPWDKEYITTLATRCSHTVKGDPLFATGSKQIHLGCR